MVTAYPPGPPARPPRSRGQRALRYTPLVLLALVCIAALVLGVSAKWIGARHPIPESTPAGDAVSDACTPPVAAPASEPWLAGDGSAEKVWQEHSEELSKPYIQGPNGWTFWGDYVDQYASQAVGRATLTQTQISAWVSYFSTLQRDLAASGADLQIVITPSTSSVYPEELPTWMQELRGSTPADQFMSQASGLPVIDLRQKLIDAKTDDVHLFSWSNSHWTDYGGYIGWKQIADCINARHPVAAALRVPAISGHKVIGDFNEWASYGVASPGEDWAAPVFADQLEDVTYTDKSGATVTGPGSTVIDSSVLPVTTQVAASWTGKSALVVRDSMGGAISPYLDQAYSPTWQVANQFGAADPLDVRALVAQHHPGVVIIQFAERHLISPPASAGG